MGERGRDAILRHHTWAIRAADIDRVLQKALAARSRMAVASN
jgi:hypothetical protein